jgi:hypothetical protein
MIKWILGLGIGMNLMFNLNAQPIIFPPDINITAQDIKPVIQDQEVIGYYAYSIVDSKHGHFNYKIVLMNSIFQVTHKFDYTSPISFPGGIDFIRFNGSAFWIVSATVKRTSLAVDIMNLDGKVIQSKLIENYKIAECEFGAGIYFLPIFNKGFIRTGPEDKDHGQPVEFINNEGQVVYRIKPNLVPDKKGDKELETLDYYANTDSLLILRSSLMKHHSEKYLIEREGDWRVYNLNTGKELNLIKGQHEKGYLKPLQMFSRPGGLTIYGKYFEPKDNIEGYDSEKMLGTYRQVINNQGKVVNEKFLSWKEDWNQLKYNTSKKCITDTSSFWIHSIVEMANGRIFATAEAFDRGLSKASFNTGVYIGDMVLVELNQDFELVSARYFEKKRFKNLTTGINNSSDIEMGEMVKNTFEYQYSSMNVSRSIFTSVYTTYDHTSGRSDDEVTLAAVGCNQDGDLVNPKIVLSNKHKNVGFIPARSGYAALLELDPKEKTVSLTLYKFDM